MTEVYTPYWDWECYKNGLWRLVSKNERDSLIDECMSLMTNEKAFTDSMREACFAWENSMLNFLTSNSINKRAYLGQCGVCFKTGIPAIVTKHCWKHISPDKQNRLNHNAENIIKEWKRDCAQKLMTTLASGRNGVTRMAYQMNLL